MALHRLTKVTIGVPNPDETAAYYTDFGVTPVGNGAFATEDGGEQLSIVERRQRSLVELAISADDQDDLGRIAARLDKLRCPHRVDGEALIAHEPVAGFVVKVHVVPRLSQRPVPPTPYNGPARIERVLRAPGVLRDSPIKPKHSASR